MSTVKATLFTCATLLGDAQILARWLQLSPDIVPPIHHHFLPALLKTVSTAFWRSSASVSVQAGLLDPLDPWEWIEDEACTGPASPVAGPFGSSCVAEAAAFGGSPMPAG